MRNAQDATPRDGSVRIDIADDGDAVRAHGRPTMARAWTRISCASACSARSTAPRVRRAWESAPTRRASTRAVSAATSRCESAPGRGHAFLHYPAGGLMSEAANPDKPRLLIVEDDLGLQKQLKWCFDEYEVLIAARSRGSAGADRAASSRRWCCRISACRPMPKASPKACARCAEILSLAPHTKVIVVTGNDDRDNAVRAVSLGAYDFYQKPRRYRRAAPASSSRAFHMHALEAAEPPAARRRRSARRSKASSPPTMRCSRSAA